MPLSNNTDLDVLRFLTCGSIDDGKSTLIGRLLNEANKIFEDHFDSLRIISTKYGTQGDEIDFALLLDGLAAEQEQGITIDVAYRYFSTNKRKFIVADTPGHEEYTRNMVTGASTAELSVLLVDARHGLQEQTKRHSHIISLLGIKHVVLAVNKMDLVNFDEEVFNQITQSYTEFSKNLFFDSVVSMPLSALKGENVARPSSHTPWYRGPSLLEHLETVLISPIEQDTGFAMPVQWVNRRTSHFRGYAGMISHGKIRQGDHIRILPTMREAKVNEILLGNQILPSATEGQSVLLTLDKELDISRGDAIVDFNSGIGCSDQFRASLVWMHNEPGYIGRQYWLLLGTAKVGATISNIKHKYETNTFSELPAKELNSNDIAEVLVQLEHKIPFTPYNTNRNLGGFILVDRYTFNTIAIGMIKHSLRRSDNIRQQSISIDRFSREKLNGHRGKVFWMTGLSGSGKSTIANAFERALFEKGIRSCILDGDNVRRGLNKDLGFSNADRIENIRRAAEVAKLMVDSGLVVITAFISPFSPERDAARALFDDGDFIEVYLDIPLEIAEQRDSKGLYRKAREGELPNLTGIGSVFQAPHQAEVHLKTSEMSIIECVDKLLVHL